MKAILKDGLIQHIYTEEGGFDWVESLYLFGQTVLPGGIACTVQTDIVSDEKITQRFIFSNTTDREVFVRRGDIGIYTPFNEDYRDSPTCMAARCHTHLSLCGQVSHITALRMGGGAPHIGLILTAGSLDTYSIVRAENSNDRGDFILHPSPFVLSAGETYEISWDIVSHNGREDFASLLESYPRNISLDCGRYVYFTGESVEFCARAGEDIRSASVTLNGEAVRTRTEGKRLFCSFTAKEPGEIVCNTEINGVSLRARFFVSPPLDTLISARVKFIADNQQYHAGGSPLDGAYLIYDNEEERVFYSKEYDFNAARERTAMGILIAKYLQKHNDPSLAKSLGQYTDYFMRELFDETSGTVYNDVCRDNEWHRLYNYPWAAKFFIELYRLHKDKRWIVCAAKALIAYYREGGESFYAFKIPMVEIITLLKNEGMTEYTDTLMSLFTAHAGVIIKNGTNYPAHEVRFEQSIVAPAAEIMLAMYELTGEKSYLSEAKKHLDILSLFGGDCPDHRLYKTAIRHWDGFWFGKRKLYGDTFPHYWSALSGDCFMTYYRYSGENRYKKSAEANLLGTLSLFEPDGRATCAPLFPFSVNGRRGEYRDPYANDQDWALIFISDNITSI